MNEDEKAFGRLIQTIHTLRAPGGCPWDIEQTPLSLRRDLVEETFEAIDAIAEGEPSHVKEELGDVILNTSMMMYMYEQNGNFSVADALNELTDKLIRRHPHVFKNSEGASVADKNVSTSEEVLNQWDKIKEKVEHRTGKDSILDEVPRSFPPLLRAYKMQKKASKKGFDWKTIEPVIEKIYEEIDEVKEAAKKVDENKEVKPFTKMSSEKVDDAQLHVEEEIGDLFFAVVNYSRHLGVDPEIAMSRANEKFYNRFSYVEKQMALNNIPMDAEHLEQADAFWDEAKKL